MMLNFHGTCYHFLQEQLPIREVGYTLLLMSVKLVLRGFGLSLGLTASLPRN